MSESSVNLIGRKRFWLLAAAALILAAALFFLLWWPVPADEAYELKLPLETPELILAIREPENGSREYETRLLAAQLLPRSPLLAQRAARSFGETVLLWSSSDPGVAAVDADGHVTAVEKGSAVITVRYGDLSESLPVRVYYPLLGFSLSEHELILEKTDRFSFGLAPFPSEAEFTEPLTFLSTDESVVKVLGDGSVEPVEAGTATVICRTGGLEDRCTVTVLPDVFPLEGIRLKAPELSLARGGTAQLEILYSPENTTDDRTALFEAADPDVVSVDENGRITALAAGETTVTARVGAFEAQCRVSVSVPLESIAIEGGDRTVARGDTLELSVLFTPEDTSEDRGVRWESTDPDTAAVDENGIVSALQGGTVTITAVCGACRAEIALTVEVPMTELRIEPRSLILEIGQSASLTASVLPEDTTESQKLTWSSSDSGIAAVDQSGRVTAIRSGVCRITVSHGAFSASCSVAVRTPGTVSAPDDSGTITVVLDAGHGVYFPGATAVDGTNEKTLNMETMLACKWALENQYSNIRVYITRNYDTPYYPADTYVRADVRNRADWAASKGALIVVCMHYNAGGGTGSMVYYATAPNVTDASRALAGCILSRLVQLGFRDAGLRVRYLTESDEYGVAGEDHFSIIRTSAYHGIPAVLVEHCFIDSASDYAKLDTSAMGWADAEGIVDYLRGYLGLTVRER